MFYPKKDTFLIKKLLLFFLIFYLYGFAKDKVVTAIPEHFPPHYQIDTQGKPFGFAVEVYEEVAKLAGLEIEYIVVPSIKEAAALVVSGEADAMPNSGITPKRLKSSLYTSPMETFQIKAFKRKSSFSINNLEDIENKKVVVVKENVGVQLMKQHPKELLMIVENKNDALLSLLSGESDIFIYPAITVYKLLKELDLKDKIIPLKEPIKEIKRAIRVNKNKPELAKKLDLALRKFIHTKKYQELYIKYFGQNEFVEIKKSNLTMIQIGIGILVVVLLIIIAFYIRTTRLKNEINNVKQRFEKMFRTHDAIMFLIDPESGKIIDANKSAAKFYGYTHQELLSMLINDLNMLSPEEIKKQREEALRYDHNYFEFPHKIKDGSVRTVEVHSSPIETDNGMILFSIIKDITKLKQYEEELEHSNEELQSSLDTLKYTTDLLENERHKYKAILDLASDGVHILDKEGNLLQFSRSFAKILGYTEDEMRELNVKDWVDSISHGELLALIDELIYNPRTFEVQAKRKNGERISLQVNASGIELEGEMYLYASARDITNMKLIEGQAKLASMGEMIGNIAHQWRQPLSIITTSASGMKMQAEFGKEIKTEDIGKFSDLIVQQAEYLSNTIDNFRNFIKGESSYRKITIGKVFESTFSLVSATIKNNNITLITDIQEDAVLYGNSNELTEAFINIINNAKDALKENVANQEDRLLFIVAKQISDTSLEVKIKDSGGGIKEDIIDRIFEPYFTLKHQSVGTGLGLSMAEKIIRERHHGSIEAYNEEFEYNSRHYKGACFRVLFKINE